MDADTVRERATALCEALVAGDVGRATESFSSELRRNLGEVLALLPLPATDGIVESVEHGGTAYVVTLRLTGETDEVVVQTRWKDRDGRPTIVEASHLSRTARAAGEPAEGEETGADEANGGAASG